MNEGMNSGDASNNLTNNVDNVPSSSVVPPVEPSAIENIPDVEAPVEPQNVNVEVNNVTSNPVDVEPSVEPQVATETPQIQNVETPTAVINEVVNDISTAESNVGTSPMGTPESMPEQSTLPPEPQESQSTSEPKKKSKLPIIILIVILVAAICAGVFYFLQTQKSTKNIYQKTIGDFSNALISDLDSADKKINNLFAASYNLSFNIKGLGEGSENLSKTLNKLKLNSEIQADLKNDKMYLNLDALYDTGSMLKAELLLKDKALYLNIPDLYNKVIKIGDVETVEKNPDLTDCKTVIQEFSNILKSSLKDEWFSKTKETINVLGSDVKAYKHTLTLDGPRMKEFATSIIDGMSNNDKLLTALSNMSGKTKDELKTTISSMKENIQVGDESLVISIYVDKNDKLQKLTMKDVVDGVEENLELSLTDIDTFEILLDKEKVGTLITKEDDFELTLNADGTSMSIVVKENDKNLDMSIKLESLGTSMEFNCVVNDKKGNLKLLLSSPEEGLDFSLDLQIEQKDITSVKEFDVSNAINMEEISDKDMETIGSKIENNEHLLKLLEDLSNSGLMEVGM